jgi:hypothetical protein
LGVATSLTASDVAPTALTQASVTAALGHIATVKTRWAALKVDLVALNARLKAAGLAPVILQ